MATDRPTELGMVGLGRMGSNLVRRLVADGHRCVAYDVSPEAVTRIAGEGAVGASTIDELVGALRPPRTVSVMVPAGEPTEAVVRQLSERLEPGDVVIDGGNTNHRDDLRRARELAERGIRLVDCGTSGDLFGLHRGFCLMVGADEDVFEHLEPIFASLAPGADAAPRTRDRTATLAGRARLPALRFRWAPGHFVKMVHNGIEYGLWPRTRRG
jgi:6-phosphogluconate dehydrogenase